jgi:hypothetical protein
LTPTTDDGGVPPAPREVHLGELRLRRLLAGESLGFDHAADAAHATSCPECTERLEALAEEQRAFERRISFDRFAAGVERAARVPGPARRPHWWQRPASTRSFLTVMSVGSLAAAFALVIGVRPLFESARLRRAENAAFERINRTKGAGPAGVIVRVAAVADGPQRTATADAPEPLARGELIRVGVRSGAHRFLFAISIDDHAVVTPLYPEVGTSMPLPRGDGLHYLPDSLELMGKGRERLVVLLTDVPLELDDVRRAVAVAFQHAGGDLDRLPNLVIAGEQFHRMFVKP